MIHPENLWPNVFKAEFWPRRSCQKTHSPCLQPTNFHRLGDTKLYNLHQLSFVTTRMTSLNITLAKDHLLYKGWEKNWNGKRHVSTQDVLIETWRVAPNPSLVRVVTMPPSSLAPFRSPVRHKRQATNRIALHMKLLHLSFVHAVQAW